MKSTIPISLNPLTLYHRETLPDNKGIVISVTQRMTEPDHIAIITMSKPDALGVAYTILEQEGELAKLRRPHWTEQIVPAILGACAGIALVLVAAALF